MCKVVITIIGLLLIAAPAVRAEGEGHYQLASGKYLRYDGTQGTYVEANDVFLLDTVTGDVSVLVSSTDDKGRRARYWEPLIVDETQTKPTFGLRE